LYRINQGLFFALYRFYQGEKLGKPEIKKLHLKNFYYQRPKNIDFPNYQRMTLNKKNNANDRKRAELEAHRLKIKKELEDIIKKTEEQNKALGKIMKDEDLKKQ